MAQAHAALEVGLGVAEMMMAGTWAAGEAFSMAHCAAAPALFYVDMAIAPLAGSYPSLTAYLERPKQGPSYAHVLEEAQPYLQFVPR